MNIGKLVNVVLGTGWKTVTGVMTFAAGKIGLVGAVASVLHGVAGVPASPAPADDTAATIGLALAVIGLIHKGARVNWSAAFNAVKVGLQSYVEAVNAPPAPPVS